MQSQTTPHDSPRKPLYRQGRTAFGIIADGHIGGLPRTRNAADGARQHGARVQILALDRIERLMLLLCIDVAVWAK